jgi:hypothetical protein
MKKFILWIFLISSLYSNIDEEIDKIQKAPIKDRYKLMNILKEKIVKMKEEERLKSISKLKLVTQGKMIKHKDDKKRIQIDTILDNRIKSTLKED